MTPASERPKTEPKNMGFECPIPLVFEIAPPVWALTHFFTLGVYEMKVPIGMWIGMVIPGIILTLMTFYYSVLFVRRSF